MSKYQQGLVVTKDCVLIFATLLAMAASEDTSHYYPLAAEGRIKRSVSGTQIIK